MPVISPTLTTRLYRPLWAIGSLVLSTGIVGPARADFLTDSSAHLESRTYYFNSDMRDGSSANPQGASKHEESAQGFILDLQSGFTEGPIGFGVDAVGMLGLKLDSSPADSNSGLLPSSGHQPRGAADQYAKAGVAGKLRFAQTRLKFGALLPDMPLLRHDDTRLLPAMFHGTQLASTDIPGLIVTATRLERYTGRDSTDAQDIRLNCKNKRYTCDTTGNRFDAYQADYQITEHFQLQYARGGLENVYRQSFVGVVGRQPLGPGQANVDLRWFDSDDDGAARAGRIDNRTLSALLGYSLGNHTLSVGWQRLTGDSSMPYLDGSTPYLVNYVQYNDFANAGERSWQLRYDYDFRGLGIPGLSLLTRYVSGDHIEVAGDQEGREWERNVEFKYVVQNGTFKGLNLRLRNATYRTNFEESARDIDETRLIATYNFSLL
ncbi:OprD family porin [Pseudomonas sp. PDM17]|uniref:OprD family porin n=1 Tax=Pseudomonas sp. PDM17 TaxID=2769285 RepID=UPI0017870C94|nr:OprD family porin [Pseudomonas sp. PDM17]MBD9502740.1 OprD family porin [Pseudomonas sp. PDM17]